METSSWRPSSQLFNNPPLHSTAKKDLLQALLHIAHPTISHAIHIVNVKPCWPCKAQQIIRWLGFRQQLEDNETQLQDQQQSLQQLHAAKKEEEHHLHRWGLIPSCESWMQPWLKGANDHKPCAKMHDCMPYHMCVTRALWFLQSGSKQKAKTKHEKCKNRAEVVFCRLQAGLWQEASRQSLDETPPAETPWAGFDDKSTTELESNAASQTLQAAYTR